MDKQFVEFAKDYFEGREVIGCEVGVWEAAHAERLLQTLNIKKLYLVDWYKVDIAKRKKPTAKKRMIPYEDRIQWIFKKSNVAAGDIMEELDFVYIDASHRYDPVRRDLNAYFPLITFGGLIAGHDYYEGTEEGSLMGVKPAVNEFVEQHGFKLTVGREREGYKDWWIINDNS